MWGLKDECTQKKVLENSLLLKIIVQLVILTDIQDFNGKNPPVTMSVLLIGAFGFSKFLKLARLFNVELTLSS